MKNTSIILALSLALALFAGCKNSGEQILPTISGKAGEVAVVCSKVEWESEPGAPCSATRFPTCRR